VGPFAAIMAAALIDSFPVALTAAQQIILDTMSTELQFLMSELEIPQVLQCLLAQRGCKSNFLFVALADDKVALRAIITTELGLNLREAGLTADHLALGRAATSGLVAAWNSAHAEGLEVAKIAAESRALRLPAYLPATHLVALRKKYETLNGRVEDSIWPCASMLEKRMEEVELGTMAATGLGEVICVLLSNDEEITISDIKVRRPPKAIALPMTTEDFRRRMLTLAISFVVAGFKHAHKLWLKTATLENFRLYVEFILGERVAGASLDNQGLGVAADWLTVLQYEFAIRRYAVREILYSGKDFWTALKEAMKDPELRERYLVTPTTVAHALKRRGASDGQANAPAGAVVVGLSNRQKKRLRAAAGAAAAVAVAPPPAVVFAKGPGKGGKDKTKNKTAGKTPDGKIVCRNFCTAAGCSFPNCKFLHTCNLCFKPHAFGVAC
jgi:hypothetical protein